MEMPGSLLFYLRGSKALPITAPPLREDHLYREARGQRRSFSGERGTPRHLLGTRGGELRVRIYRASPAPRLESQWRETGLSDSRQCPRASERTLSPRALSPTHSPAPRRSSGSLRSQQPSRAAPQPFPPPDPAGLVPACVRSGAERIGLVHVTPSERGGGGGGGDEVRKREASTSTVLSESIPYVELRTTAL